MKKILTSICAIALILVVGLGFGACKGGNKLAGTYKVRSAEAMGMSATAESFKNYAASRSDDEKANNSLYNVFQLIMNMQITIKNDKSVTLKLPNFKSLMADDAHYSSVYEKAKSYVQSNGDFIMSDLKLNEDPDQADCYYIERVDANGNPLTDERGYYVGFTDVFGSSLTKIEYIHARVKSNQMAFTWSIVMNERDGQPAQSAFSTTINIYMSK